MDQRRFALYFVPPANSELYRFGARFLGYDCYSGSELGYPPDSGLDAHNWAELTREPRRYGFHATLKAPFRLRPACTEADLGAELDRFCASPRRRATIVPVVRALGRFIALVADKPSREVDRLAADCVMAFDRFRAPLTAQEQAKRLAADLSTRQIEHVERWGYPFVFDDFQFHMTLTGSVEENRRDAIAAMLQARFDRSVADRSVPISRLVLARQDGPSTPFRVVRETELAAARA
jgi:putative phosphonate metabolism protein